MDCCADHYARRLIHRDDVRGYSIVAMTWGPKQGLRSRSRRSVVLLEGVFKGSIEVQQYEMTEHRDQRFRLSAVAPSMPASAAPAV